MTPSLSDAVNFPDQYETLRREALGSESPWQCRHGLALFLTRGMMAWTEVLSTLGGRLQPTLGAEERPPATSIPVLPAALQPDMTTLLADMVLVCSPEIEL